MTRYVRLIVLGLAGLALLIIALANRSAVTVRLLPDDLATLAGLNWVAEVPLFLVIFGGIVVGVLVGFVWEWFREHGHRATANTKAREVTRLERELAVLKDSTSAPPKDDVLALLEKR
jgi:lipopolysaccharide assembly protein A